MPPFRERPQEKKQAYGNVLRPVNPSFRERVIAVHPLTGTLRLSHLVIDRGYLVHDRLRVDIRIPEVHKADIESLLIEFQGQGVHPHLLIAKGRRLEVLPGLGAEDPLRGLHDIGR